MNVVKVVLPKHMLKSSKDNIPYNTENVPFAKGNIKM